MARLDGATVVEEVEAVLSTHPSVTDTAVVGVPDDRYGELVVACAVGNGASGADLDTHCRASDLADFKRPQAYLFLPGLPRNSLAKVLRSELRGTAAEAHRSGQLTYISPASPPPPGHHSRPAHRPPAEHGDDRAARHRQKQPNQTTRT